MSEIKVSVIIPVYNGEKFLNNCLRSVAAQTLKDMEVIVVNDGSTDSSLVIAKSFEDKYRHFKVISQENRGLSVSRNTGLDRAAGNYIGFLDSDDFTDPLMYEQLYKIALEQKSDFVKCGAILFDDNSREIIQIRSDFDLFTEISDNLILLKKYLKKQIHRNVWNGIYHHKIFKKLRFPDGVNYEDQYVTPNVLMVSNKYTYLPRNFYYYRKHAGGITQSSNPDYMVDRVQSLNELFRIIKYQQYMNDLSFYYSRYFYKMIIDYHNSVIYSTPGYLRRNFYSIKNVINPDAFEYVFSCKHLTQKEEYFLRVMRKSHYLYFPVQKLNLIKDVVLRKDTLFKKSIRQNTVDPDQTNKRYSNMIDRYA